MLVRGSAESLNELKKKDFTVGKIKTHFRIIYHPLSDIAFHKEWWCPEPQQRMAHGLNN